MLLSECVNGLEYPLAWSRAGRCTALFVLVVIAGVGLLLYPYPELVAVIWLGVWRCYVIWRRDLSRLSQLRVRLTSYGDLLVSPTKRVAANFDEYLHIDEVETGYQVQAAVRFPGFGRICLQSMSGKRLEILIFYRYDLRHSYWRLMRHVYQQSALQNYD